MRFYSRVMGVGLVFLMGCDPGHSNPKNKNGEPIISQEFQEKNLLFPKGVPLFIATVKLVNPALLETVTSDENGKLVVDENLKARIESEQEDFILKLQGMSEDIQIIHQFKMVLNAVTIEAPQELAEKINDLPVDFIQGQRLFERPDVVIDPVETVEAHAIEEKNSMTAIGVDLIHKTLKVKAKDGTWIPVKGRGIKIGVIDSGIDYTHSMLGGSGDIADFQAIVPSKNSSHFPNSKVVGGKDFVGTYYNPSSHLYVQNRPFPDNNPIDTSGHGTHVAGTVGGIGDGINTYDGAAPEAELYALKVFGDKGGGTSEAVVIAALEYAVDPKGDGSMDGKLDVVNLSLGNSYGKPAELYSEAIKNLTKAGVVAVGSAGNNGAVSNIVSSPGISEELISVAASVDYMDHNLDFEAVKVSSQDQTESFLFEFAEGVISRPLAETSSLSGKLVYIGTAATEISGEMKAALKGHVALIDRGGVDFATKFKYAEAAGAIGVLMLNNQDGGPTGMGGDGRFKIPGVMISLSNGLKIKEAMKTKDMFVDFKTPEKIRKEELIDTIADFSSQGPRSFDALIKPEISAPGLRIISAAAGKGHEGVKNNGTSMASPHVAGVIGLLKQYRPELNPRELKALIMNTAKEMDDANQSPYSVSRQGAGLIRAFDAAQTELAVLTSSLSLGKFAVQDRVISFKTIEIKNLGKFSSSYTFEALSTPELNFTFSPAELILRPGETKDVSVKVEILAPSEELVEIDTFVHVKKNGVTLSRVPVLAVLNRTTDISVESINVVEPRSGQSLKSIEVNLANQGVNGGEALLFNLLGQDDRKADPKLGSLSADCDLESSGYRVIQKNGEKVFQIAVKIFNPVSNWEACSVRVEMDTDSDEAPDFELVGSFPSYWRLGDEPEIVDAPLSNILFDYMKLDKLWLDYQDDVKNQPMQIPELSFKPALISISPMTTYNSSTLALVEAPLDQLRLTNGLLGVKVSASYTGRYNVEMTDILQHGDLDWKTIDISETGNSYFNIPERVLVNANAKASIQVLAGSETYHDLVAYYPRNVFSARLSGRDQQSEIIEVVKPVIMEAR